MTFIVRSEKNHQFGEPLFRLTLYAVVTSPGSSFLMVSACSCPRLGTGSAGLSALAMGSTEDPPSPAAALSTLQVYRLIGQKRVFLSHTMKYTNKQPDKNPARIEVWQAKHIPLLDIVQWLFQRIYILEYKQSYIKSSNSYTYLYNTHHQRIAIHH